MAEHCVAIHSELSSGGGIGVFRRTFRYGQCQRLVGHILDLLDAPDAVIVPDPIGARWGPYLWDVLADRVAARPAGYGRVRRAACEPEPVTGAAGWVKTIDNTKGVLGRDQSCTLAAADFCQTRRVI